MIFVTVGAMFPFDRLISSMDAWARANPEIPCLAQIGAGEYVPKHMQWVRMLTPTRFARQAESARLIVAHSGVGSALTAAKYGKAIVLVPRYAAAKEHTTDHQLHTAQWLEGRPGIVIAKRDDDLDAKIRLAMTLSGDRSQFSEWAPRPFIEKIRNELLK